MTRIIQGVLDFQQHVYGKKRELFRDLGKGQKPLALFITCSDSRILPDLLAQTEPGELFVLRNAGNLVPPYSEPAGTEAGTIEYAVVQLKVRDVIICGHSKCGAMHGLLEPAAWAKGVDEHGLRAVLLDLASDPSETKNVLKESAAEAERLIAALRTLGDEQPHQRQRDHQTRPEDADRDHLQDGGSAGARQFRGQGGQRGHAWALLVRS